MRCLTLADALRQRGADCRFVCREHEGNLLGLIRERGHKAVALPTSKKLFGKSSNTYAAWIGADAVTDAEETLTALTGESVDWMIVDHYGIDTLWERYVKAVCGKLMVIDDLADRSHHCDLLVDQNLVANPQSRYSGRVPDHCSVLVGPRYAMLAPIYAELHQRVMPRGKTIGRVMVYFGGADAENLTGKTISAFLAIGRKDVELDVVVNPQSPHLDSIRRQTARVEWIRVHLFLPSLSGLMNVADVSIGAGGMTTWERCCLGVPSYVITLADNQTAGAMELDRLGVIRWLGNADALSIEDLTTAFSEMLSKPSHAELSTRGLTLVDGLGCRRIIDGLMASGDSRLVARLACPDDEDLILRWANDPVVRKNSFSSERIDPTDHHQWFTRRLANRASCYLFIVETEAGLPIGQVRFEGANGRWEVHYALDAGMRGRGMGGVFLRAALSAFQSRVPCCTEVVGRVLSENHASQKVLEQLGFVEQTDGNHSTYRLSFR